MPVREKEQEFLLLREGEQPRKRMAPWRECNVRWSDGGGFACHREVQSTSGVCVWARTDSPTTLHSPAITAPTTKQNIRKNGSWIRQGKMGKSKQGGDTWIFSHG